MNFCSLMTEDEDFNNFNLYSNVIFISDGKVTYDCRDGEKFFDPKKYIPQKKEFKSFKDMFDCKSKNNESNCHKNVSKFVFDDMLACWHKIENPRISKMFWISRK